MYGCDPGTPEDGRRQLRRGFMFGDRVDRGRKWETSFQLHIDQCLLEGGQKLRAPPARKSRGTSGALHGAQLPQARGARSRTPAVQGRG